MFQTKQEIAHAELKTEFVSSRIFLRIGFESRMARSTFAEFHTSIKFEQQGKISNHLFRLDFDLQGVCLFTPIDDFLFEWRVATTD